MAGPKIKGPKLHLLARVVSIWFKENFPYRYQVPPTSKDQASLLLLVDRRHAKHSLQQVTICQIEPTGCQIRKSGILIDMVIRDWAWKLIQKDFLAAGDPEFFPKLKERIEELVKACDMMGVKFMKRKI